MHSKIHRELDREREGGGGNYFRASLMMSENDKRQKPKRTNIRTRFTNITVDTGWKRIGLREGRV